MERTGGFETVAFCEIEKFPQQVLKKHWPDVPIYEDVRELDRDRLNADGLGTIDIITAGYPCQPFSIAGKRRGAEDDRHLWPEVKRLMASVRPRWVIAENVAGHINMGLDEVLSDMEDEGYTCWPLVIPACAIDAPHRRSRVWIVANDDRQRSGTPRPSQVQAESTTKASTTSQQSTSVAHTGRISEGSDTKLHGDAPEWSQREPESTDGSQNVPNTNSDNAQGQQSRSPDQEERQGQEQRQAGSRDTGAGRLWPVEPAVGRVAHGIPRRVDRLKGLGNAVVPQIPEIIGNAILDVERGLNG